MKLRFPGSLTALITPFRDGAIDREALERIVEDQIANGIDGLVPCGSTGESATLTHDEHIEVIKLVVELRARPRAGDRRHRLELHRRGDPR